MDESVVLLSTMSPKVKTQSYIKSNSKLSLNELNFISIICYRFLSTGFEKEHEAFCCI